MCSTKSDETHWSSACGVEPTVSRGHDSSGRRFGCVQDSSHRLRGHIGFDPIGGVRSFRSISRVAKATPARTIRAAIDVGRTI
jgi:hypothetical protein